MQANSTDAEVGVGVARYVSGESECVWLLERLQQSHSIQVPCCLLHAGAANVHLLPCKIHLDGPAPVSTYFQPRPDPEEAVQGALQASFRGRRLL
jgi:Ribonuclease H2 non-catalytic subunit (Ylr154p-like)